MAVGRSESGVLTSEEGAESSPKLRLARSEWRKAAEMSPVSCSLSEAKYGKASVEIEEKAHGLVACYNG
jgi:hypothetical protein